MTYRFLVFCIFLIWAVKSDAQEFYLDNNGEIKHIFKPIQSNWKALNQNEAFNFLNNSGFENISSEALGDKSYVVASFSSDNYSFKRTLIFEKNIISSYVDQVQFLAPCLTCLSEQLRLKTAGNPIMKSIVDESMAENIEKDRVSKNLVLNKFYSLCDKDQLIRMTGEVNIDFYDVQKSKRAADVRMMRSCKVELDDQFYMFYLSKLVALNQKDYKIGPYQLKEIDTYDLFKMIDVFLEDCAEHGIELVENIIDAKFESLEGDIVGLSYAKENDQLIKIKVDPKAWSLSSEPKRWYLIYHELGHDVLNLDHGNGGKMMFNFIDRGYSWNEFWEDKNYMLNNYIK